MNVLSLFDSNFCTYSIFKNRHYVLIDNTYQWITEYNIYHGDLSCINTAVDKRFCKVEGMRNEVMFMGMAINITFPVTYPILLVNGNSIEQIQ